VVLVAVLLLGGCSAFASGEAVRLAGGQAVPTTEVVANTDIEPVKVREVSLSRTYGTGDANKEVEFVTEVAHYQKSRDTSRRYVVLTSPTVTGMDIAGNIVNPVRNAGPGEMTNYTNLDNSTVSDIRPTHDTALLALDTPVRVEYYQGSATTGQSSEYETEFAVTQFIHDGDHVIVLGVAGEDTQGFQDEFAQLARNLTYSGN